MNVATVEVSGLTDYSPFSKHKGLCVRAANEQFCNVPPEGARLLL